MLEDRMTHPKHTEPGVTQADREAAEALAEWAFPEGLRDAAIVDIAEDFACHRTAAEAASRAEVERLREACERILRRQTEWRAALANWSGALHMSRKEAEAVALEMDWAAFVIRAALSPADGGE